MKFILSLLGCCAFFFCGARSATINKLTEVNACWSAQPEVVHLDLPAYKDKPGTEWIRMHLSLVEKILRQRSTTHLNAAQIKLRSHSLDDLHRYWLAGNFPHNEMRAYRTPVFIDPYDNFCAVGYLVKASGYESVSRMIAAKTNLSYVKEMHYPELDQWAVTHGFTKDELAWIQPAYPPENDVIALGKGVNGSVVELQVGQNGDKLYVGGSFDKADSIVESQNIACVTKDMSGNYTWHDMGGGTNGPVNAIAEYDGKIFAGGSFGLAGGAAAGNIAFWDNSGWHDAGCVSGTVEKLIVFDGELYAAGTFDLCGGMADINFARREGSGWVGVPGLSGTVKTMEVIGDKLLLGGNFKYQNNEAHAIAWNKTAGFLPFDNAIKNTVLDFEKFKGTLYAVCDRTDEADSTGIMMKLEGNEWKSVFDPISMPFMPLENVLRLNTLVTDGDYLLTGGQFFATPDIMSFSNNCVDVTPQPYSRSNRYFWVDSAVTKMTWFKNELIVGGKFHRSMNFTGSGIPVNGIGVRRLGPTIVGDPGNDPFFFKVYPNPASHGICYVQHNFAAGSAVLYDLRGKKLLEQKLPGTAEIQAIPLRDIPAGIYLLNVSNEEGKRKSFKLLIQ